MTTPKRIQKDNGYFEVWEKPCGHRVRINTESFGMALRRPAFREKFDADTRDRLANATCVECSR